MCSLHTLVAETRDEHGGRIPVSFVDAQIEDAIVTHTHLTANMRVCVIRLQSGHEVIGVAQVLDASNDVEEIGQHIAFENAKNELWKVFGAIALS